MFKNMIELPVIENIRSAVYYAFANVGLVAKVAAPWILIYAGYTLFFQYLGIGEYFQLIEDIAFATEFPTEARDQGIDRLPVLKENFAALTAQLGIWVQIHEIFDNILRLIIYSSVAVELFRIQLLDEEIRFIHFAKREWKFILYAAAYIAVIAAIGYGISVAFIATESDTIRGFYYSILAVFMLFLTSRFLLVFPSLATDEQAISPLVSWQKTAGNGWKMFFGMLLVILSSLPISIFKVTVAKIALPIAIIWPTQMLLSMIILAFILSFLVNVYKHLVLNIGNEKQAPLF